jgi:3-isopropylmalate/(R)-2-methylmalate dehydratase small subunit
MDDMKVVEIGGRAVPVRGDDIDTDRIFPARFMKEITFRGAAEHVFRDARFNAGGIRKAHPFNEPAFQGASILIANANFGCGSSREHAPLALARWGIRAIVAESYGEIFAGNCAMRGVAAVSASRADIACVQEQAEREPQTAFVIDLGTMMVRGGGLSIPVAMPAGRRQALVNGTWDVTRLMLANAPQARDVAARLTGEFR